MLTINGPEDSINHFGISESVNVQAVANDSYHEYGAVVTLTIESGHAVIENVGVVSSLVNNSTTEKKVEIKGYVGAVSGSSSENIEGNIGGDTIKVYTSEQLKGLALSSVVLGLNDKTIDIQNDINVSGSWIPFGFDSKNPFSGTIKGNGHTISGLNSDGFENAGLGTPVSSSFTDATGIPYGFIGTAAGNLYIENLTLEVSFNRPNEAFVGGLVGLYNNVSNGTTGSYTDYVKNVTIKGTIIGKDKVGGFYGANGKDFAAANIEHKYESCVNEAEVIAKAGNGRVGGICGVAQGQFGEEYIRNSACASAYGLESNYSFHAESITKFINCTNRGHIVSMSGSFGAGGIMCINVATGNFVFESCSSTGVLEGNKTGKLIANSNIEDSIFTKYYAEGGTPIEWDGSRSRITVDGETLIVKKSTSVNSKTDYTHQ